MILGAVLLTLIGSADLVRSSQRLNGRRTAAIVIVVVWAAVLAVTVTGFGAPLWWAVVPVVPAVLWLWTTSSRADARTAAGILPGVGVLVLLVVGLLADPLRGSAAGYLVDWHGALAVASIRSLPVGVLALGVGFALFLIESANIVVRAALRPAVDESRQAVASAAAAEAQSTSVTAPRRAWWRRPAPVPVVAPVVDLRGGRLIGPLERLLIVALTLSGGLAFVAGLIAAKGIVRFPEISNDGARGSKAEYFLVGSLVSWAIAVAATGILWISAQG